MKQTLASFTITPATPWGSAPTVRVWANSQFRASTGELHPAGSEAENYTPITLTPSGAGFTFPSSVFDTTDDSSDPNATYSAAVYNGTKQVYALFDRWMFRASLGATVTWDDLEVANVTRVPLRDDTAYSKIQTDLRIASALNVGNPATTMTLGRVKTRTAPADPANPTVIEQGDPLLPTQDESDALAGTHGSPSSSNKYVTTADPRLVAAVNVAQFATAGDGSPGNPYTGWDTAIAWASDRTYQFNAGKVFQYSTPLVILNTHDTRLVGAGPGSSVLRFTGAGIALTVKSTSVLTYTGNCVENLEIVGNALATGGILMESQHHSTVRNVRVREVAAKGLHWVWGICNLIENFRVSHNEHTVTVRPVNGIYVEKRASGETFQGNTITNPIIEGTSGDGIALHDALQNTILGGTSEGNTAGGGIFIADTSNGNTIIATDCESNFGADFHVSGSRNILLGVLSAGTVNIDGGSGNQIIGGQMNQLNIGAGASHTILIGQAINLMGGGAGMANSSTTTQWLTRLLNIGTGSWGTPVVTLNKNAPWVDVVGLEPASAVLLGYTVTLRGAVTGGVAGTVIATLDAGQRPTTLRQRGVLCGSGLGVLSIYPNGSIVWESGGTNTIHLDGVTFDVP